jgi:hypothetical protein
MLKNDRYRHFIFMVGLVLFHIFYPDEANNLTNIIDLMQDIKSQKAFKLSSSQEQRDDDKNNEINSLLRYSLHYDPGRRHESFDAILGLPLFVKLGFNYPNLGTCYVLPVSADKLPKSEYFKQYCDEITEFSLDNKFNTFVLGNSIALYMKLCYRHLSNNLPNRSDEVLCKNMAAYALSMSILIDSSSASSSMRDVFNYFYSVDNSSTKRYSQFLDEVCYQICMNRGIMMESTYYYSPNYQIFFKSLIYYTIQKLAINSSPDSFIINLVRSHIVSVPEPKFRFLSSEALPEPENIYSSVNYKISYDEVVPIKEAPQAVEEKIENEDSTKNNGEFIRVKTKSSAPVRSRRSRQRK